MYSFKVGYLKRVKSVQEGLILCGFVSLENHHSRDQSFQFLMRCVLLSPSAATGTIFCVISLSLSQCSSNEQSFVIQELVFWDFHVVWSRSLSDPARHVVVRAVAGAEPAAELS